MPNPSDMKKFIFGDDAHEPESDDDVVVKNPLPRLGKLLFGEDARIDISAIKETPQEIIKRESSPLVIDLGKLKLPAVSQRDDSSSDIREPPSSKEFRRICSEVILGELYVSGWLVAEDWEQLESRGITHVINTACSVSKCPFQNHIVYLPLSIDDNRSEDILAYIYPCIEFIEGAISSGGRVLVHCMEGVSRSCSIAIAYIMWKQNLSYMEAQEFVQTARPVCQPNPNFICQLLDFQKRLANPSASKRSLRVTLRLCNDQLVLLAVAADGKPIDQRFPYIYQDDSSQVFRIGIDQKSEFKDLLFQLGRDAADRLARIEGFEPVIEVVDFDPSILPIPTAAYDVEYYACNHFFQQPEEAAVPENSDEPCTARSHRSHGSIDSVRDENRVKVFQLDPGSQILGDHISFFDADDLDSRYMYLFQTSEIGIIWIGNEVTDYTADSVSEMVFRLLNDPKINLRIIHQGNEPGEFWELFLATT